MNKQIQNFFRYRFLMWELIKKVIKLKLRRSNLAINRSLIETLQVMIVLSIVFGTLLGNPDRTFPVYVLTGRLLYSFYALGSRTSLTSIRSNATMIKKVYVPKYLYPLSSILANYIIFGISLIDLVGVSIYLGVMPTVYLWQIVVPLMILLIFTMGTGMILATLGVFFRDLEYLWTVILMIVMYTSAIFYYPEKLLLSEYDWILKYNPLYCIIALFRDAVFGRPMDMTMLGYASGISMFMLIVGVLFFHRKQDRFILHI